MQYLCLAYGAEDDWLALPPDRRAALLSRDEVLRARGDLVAAVSRSVATLREAEGALNVASSPIAPLPRPLAGFAIIEADSLEQAVELVTGTPCLGANGMVELREIVASNGSSPPARKESAAPRSEPSAAGGA